jgi:hypothetical protein
MSRTGRPCRTNGSVYKHSRSQFWWADRGMAERFLRDRLDARDDGELPVILAGKKLTFNEWADWFLQHRSKPPYRSEKTHRNNLEVLKTLRPAFGSLRLSDITPEAVENYIERRL